ncbi:MAG: AAA family ATPase, partial [Phycisphaerales bacterium]
KRTVIVDASQRTRVQRAPLVSAATARDVPWLLVDVDADRHTIESRMARRAADPARISDADLAIYDRLRTEREPPDEIPPAHRMQLTSNDQPGWLDAAAAAVLTRMLGELGPDSQGP